MSDSELTKNSPSYLECIRTIRCSGRYVHAGPVYLVYCCGGGHSSVNLFTEAGGGGLMLCGHAAVQPLGQLGAGI